MCYVALCLLCVCCVGLSDSIEIPEGADEQLAADLKADQEENAADARHRWANARKPEEAAYALATV